MYSRKGLGKPFLYSEETLKTLPQTISKFLRTSDVLSSDKPKSTYKGTLMRAGIIASAGVFLAGSVSLIYPLSARILWPFASAQAADEETPLLHDPSIRLLAAAINSDPNPSKYTDDITLSDGTALMATIGPNGEIEEHTPESIAHSASTGSGKISTYTVEEGDSISEIATHFGVSVNTILWANDLTVRSTITPGMTLVILPVSGAQHKVTSGETLSSIANKYNASATEIATFNGLDAGATVIVGSTLIIPKGEVTSTNAPSSAAVKSSAAAVKKTTTTTTSKTTSASAGTTKTTTTTKTTSTASGSGSADGYFSDPVPGAILYQGIHGNNSVDLSAPSGTPIYAAAAGSIIVSKGDGAWNGGYGSYVVISHGNGTQTLYAHMSKDVVSVGDTVAKGELIGYVGMTGEATGNHLHFEVRGAKNWLASVCSVMSRCY